MKKALLFAILFISACIKSQTCSLTISKNPACIGDTVWIKAQSSFTATSFVFSGPGIFSSGTIDSVSFIVANLGFAGVYTCQITSSSNTCIANGTLSVDNVSSISVASGANVCENSNAILSANGGVTYTWSGPGGYSSMAQNATIFNVQSNSAGIYTVVITSTNNCSATKQATLTVMPSPSVTIIATNSVCVGSQISLSANGGVNYSWIGPNGFNSTSQSPTLIANSTSCSGNYQVFVTDANGCIGTASTNVTVSSSAVIGISTSLNNACQPLCTNIFIMAGPGLTSATLNLGNGTTVNNFSATTCYTNPGTYTINANVVDQNGCKVQTSNTIQVNPKPIANFNYSISTHGLVNFLDASYNTPITSWNWYFNGTANTSNSQNPTFIFNDTTLNYNVCLVVKSDKGCIDTICKTVFFNTVIGINENLVDYSIKTYPNPIKDHLTIETDGSGILEIYDMLGGKLLTQAFNKGKNRIELQQLSGGIYIMRMKKANSYFFSRKIVKE